MKRGVLCLAAIAMAWVLPALADPAAAPSDVFLTTQGDGQYLAKDLLLGAKVHNAEGAIVGDIEDLILNADNQVEGVVMGTGGFAGFGEKRVGVKLSALQIKNEDGKITVTLPEATKEALDTIEPFKRSTPPKSLLDRAIEKAQELSDKGSVTAKDAYEKAKKEAGPALEKAGETAKQTYEQVKEKATPVLEKAGEAAKDAYNKARDAVETKPAEESAPAAEEAAPAAEPESTPEAAPEAAPEAVPDATTTEEPAAQP